MVESPLHTGLSRTKSGEVEWHVKWALESTFSANSSAGARCTSLRSSRPGNFPMASEGEETAPINKNKRFRKDKRKTSPIFNDQVRSETHVLQ